MSLLSIAKANGYGQGELNSGRHPVTTKRMARKIKSMRIMERISPFVQQFIMQPEHSWIEKLETHEKLKLDDINTHIDLFYVLSGAIEFTMREDPIHRARKRGEQSDGSLITESAFSVNSDVSLVQ